MNILLDKFKEVSLSVLPITIIVLILNFTIAPVPGDLFLEIFNRSRADYCGTGNLLLGGRSGDQ